MKKILAISALSLATSLPAFADTYNNSGHFLLGAGLTFGGETLATVTYTDGSSSDIKSGGLVHFYGGYEYRFANRVSIQTTLGYHVDDRSAKNGSVRFTRYPVEVLGYYGLSDELRIGGGLRYVMNPEISSSGVISGTNYSFDDTSGIVLEGEYMVSQHVGVKVRAVSEKYKLQSSSPSISGNHGGIYANYYF